MFYIRMALTGFWRYRIRTALHFMICILSVLFLGIYTGNLDDTTARLEELAKKVPVRATVINLAGGRESGLFIKEPLYDGVMASPYVSEPDFTLELLGAKGKNEYTVLAQTSLKGYEDLFSSNEKKCVVTPDFLKDQKLKEGDTLKLDLKYYKLDAESHLSSFILPLETVSYQIAGIAEGENSAAQIMIPMETARESYRNQDIPFFVSSGTFRVKNPLELNGFKKEMDAVGFLEIIPQSKPALEGYALTVKDETFIRAAGSIRESRKVLKIFFPAICAALLGAGLITSYLLALGRRQEYVTRRMLGMPCPDCIAVYLTEQGLTELLGGAAGCALSSLLTNAGIDRALTCGAVFFLCYFTATLLTAALFCNIPLH